VAINNIVKSINRRISIKPCSSLCYDFIGNGYNTKKSTWIIPHVNKSIEDSEIITWRCNWGDTCESNCLYAMNKNKKLEDDSLGKIGHLDVR
jgi:hypothetical protein